MLHVAGRAPIYVALVALIHLLSYYELNGETF